MPQVHDRGGWPTQGPIDQTEHELMDWERRVQAMVGVLRLKGIIGVDELRRAIESIPPQQYESLGYFERWALAVETLVVEKGILTREEIRGKLASLEEQGE